MHRRRMDDHKEAYLFWKEVGFFRASCLHVDAHLDISNFKAPTSSCPLYPELSCANFLLSAILEGIVSEAVWIIPPYLAGSEGMLEWFREEICRWMKIDQQDYFSFQQLGERTVVGDLAGARLMVTTAEELTRHWQPPTDRPVLLDIDIDYFLGPELGLAGDRSVVWQTPWELLEQLGPLDYAASTVADSVAGGYTPVELRCLGYLTELCLDGHSDLAKRSWEAILDLKLQVPEEEEFRRAVPSHCPSVSYQSSGWLKAARYGQELLLNNVSRDDQRWSKLSEFHPDFVHDPFDQAAVYFSRKLVDSVEPCLLAASKNADSEFYYLSAFICARQGKFREALQHLDVLASGSAGSDSRGASHFLALSGRFSLELLDYNSARQFFLKAISLDRTDEEFWRGLAECWVGLGDLREATKCLRKALTLGPKLLQAGETRLRLIELYRELGQTLLFQAETDRLQTAHPHLQERVK
jgi:tetratricopeptide (TPR) repeat protein